MFQEAQSDRRPAKRRTNQDNERAAMSLFQIIGTFRNRWINGVDAGSVAAMEPLDHPSLRSMSLRELADLPLEPRHAMTSTSDSLRSYAAGAAEVRRSAPRQKPLEERGPLREPCLSCA
jgi:hypothetical protein